jgi:rubredoxin
MTDARPAEPVQGRPSRPACPQCGSPHTQPFTYAGPVARFNMKCTDCGYLFKHKDP